MIDVANVVYTKVKTAVSDLCKSASQSFMDTPPKFPHIYIHQLDSPTVANDMDNLENAIDVSYEITVYTNSNLTQAKKISSLASDTMLQLGFQRKFGPTQIDNINDRNICRMIARYERIYGNNDKL